MQEIITCLCFIGVLIGVICVLIHCIILGKKLYNSRAIITSTIMCVVAVIIVIRLISLCVKIL